MFSLLEGEITIEFYVSFSYSQSRSSHALLLTRDMIQHKKQTQSNGCKDSHHQQNNKDFNMPLYEIAFGFGTCRDCLSHILCLILDSNGDLSDITLDVLGKAGFGK